MGKVSVLITARNEIYLENTIRNVLENAEGEIEVLVALDGYLPEPQIIIDDNRVLFYHYEKSIGQRQAINKLAEAATGKYIMKLDAHCAVDKGFDVKLAKDCEYDWTVIPRMYNLQIAEYTCKSCGAKHQSPAPESCTCGNKDFNKKDVWLPKKRKRTDYMYMSSPTADPAFRAKYFNGGERENTKHKYKDNEFIDDTMCCMGPCFFMHKDRFWELGGCDEKHGSWGQQGIEVSLKAWLSGGRLVVNKNTWFAHWFRCGGIGFPYEQKASDQDAARAYSKDLWLNDKWPQATRKLDWLIDKFDPPGWEKQREEENLQKTFYKSIHLDDNNFNWCGTRVIKMPSDIALYHEVIWANKPDFVIEIGTAYCGSAVFFKDMLNLVGRGGKVITIDPSPRVGKMIEDPNIIYLKGDSKDDKIVAQVKEIVGDKTAMLSIDGLHKRRQVKWELHKYKDIVTDGQYIVVEDCYDRHGKFNEVNEAKEWFLNHTKKYILDDIDKKYLVGMSKSGWLKKLPTKAIQPPEVRTTVNNRLSVVIPSYKDPLLVDTIQSILDNATGDIEIIPVIDGYELKVELPKDKRVKPLILKDNVGMREAINQGVAASTGEYLMRTDEHCMYAKGFDTIILSDIKDNQIVTAIRKTLDVEKWKVMDEIDVFTYEKLVISKNPWHKFSSARWPQRDIERAHIPVDETMAFQGSFWIMSRYHWDNVIKSLDSEGYGILYQDSTEMTFKTWQAGGHIMLNKNTWYAHKHRGFKRTHNYSNDKSRASFEYALKTWEDYYRKEILPKWSI